VKQFCVENMGSRNVDDDFAAVEGLKYQYVTYIFS